MRNYIQINNVSKDEWSWFLQDNGHAALVRSIDNVSNSEPNLVPGLFYTCSMCRKMLLSRSGTFAPSSVVDWYYWMECRKSYRCLVSSSMARFPSTLWERDLKFTPNGLKLITPDEDNCIFYTISFFFYEFHYLYQNVRNPCQNQVFIINTNCFNSTIWSAWLIHYDVLLQGTNCMARRRNFYL